MNYLAQKMKKWIETELQTEYPITINEEKRLDTGYYYDFSIHNSRFCLIFRDLKSTDEEIYRVKIHWILHRTLTEDEKAYWGFRYEFKFDNDELRYSRNTLHIGEIKNQEPIRFIMSREVTTLRIFSRDLKWIIKMEERRE